VSVATASVISSAVGRAVGFGALQDNEAISIEKEGNDIED
jgi:hypothetical protein